ncbi:hypothetical protein RJ639_019455 [Escallonia herrerae]|uniref:Cytochrome P450 n=1 Tax=Escallonia herrerae TaxID=1293975 RepID=A0AA88V9C4_9ASTE|nr:hypothetical protein RJ639_019455 [Escallonia herrerae]
MRPMTTITDAQLFFFLFFIWMISFLFVRHFLHKQLKSINKSVNHPPSPPALPIIGHLPLLGIILHQSFLALASRYGPLMKVSVGSSTSIVVSNATLAKEVFRTHDLNFAFRPEFGASNYSIYKGSSFFLKKKTMHDKTSLSSKAKPEMFMAGTETTSVALQWALAEIINHPDVLNKLREEISAVVGSCRLMEESDTPKLPYLQAVVKENLSYTRPYP